MSTMTSVSVNNDFTSRQSGISMRTTDNKFPGWINQEFLAIVK